MAPNKLENGVQHASVEHDLVSRSRSNRILQFSTGTRSDWISKKLYRI